MTALLLGLLVMNLWPHAAPDTTPAAEPEHDTSTAKDALIGGRTVIRLGPVSVPTLTVYPGPKGNGPNAAVLVFPGGGYRILASDLEGTEICEWLNKIGLAAVLVKYRVRAPGGAEQFGPPLQDAQRAIGIVRSHAAEWNIDPQRVGVLGFSAGGHLAVLLSNHSGPRTYPEVDSADRASSRPDFTLLIYPAYLDTVEATTRTPPLFAVQAENDKPHIDGTLQYFGLLKAAGIPAELHVYSTGGHGYGLRQTSEPVTRWPQLAQDWLKRTTGGK